jgi:hypothetical protein
MLKGLEGEGWPMLMFTLFGIFGFPFIYTEANDLTAKLSMPLFIVCSIIAYIVLEGILINIFRKDESAEFNEFFCLNLFVLILAPLCGGSINLIQGLVRLIPWIAIFAWLSSISKYIILTASVIALFIFYKAFLWTALVGKKL